MLQRKIDLTAVMVVLYSWQIDGGNVIVVVHPSAVWHFSLSSGHLEWGMIFQAAFVERNAPLAIKTTTHDDFTFCSRGLSSSNFFPSLKNEDWKKKTALRTAASCWIRVNFEFLSFPELFLRHCWIGVSVGLCCEYEYISWTFCCTGILDFSHRPKF